MGFFDKDNKFCNKCGSELIEIPRMDKNAFDSKTGKRKVNKVCPVDQCEHYGRQHKYSSKWYGYTTCEKCGIYLGDY